MKLLLGLVFTCLMASVASQALAQPDPTVLTRDAALSAADQVADMGPGINVMGWDAHWWGAPSHYNDETFATIRQAGFKTVRIVLTSFEWVRDDGTLDHAWLKRVDSAVAMALRNDLNVILDEHDYNDCAKDANACAILLKTIWGQLAPRYRDQPQSVMFELLNEPHGTVDADKWNQLFPELLAIVRKDNPTRNILIGPAHWNNRSHLPLLKLPQDDRHIIVAFHYYEPLEFTHQGTDIVGTEIQAIRNLSFGTPEELAKIEADFDGVAAWSKANDRPIVLGEFGTFESAPMADRARWTYAVARAAEARGFAFLYWRFSDDFTVYDFKTKTWVKPILKALLPGTSD